MLHHNILPYTSWVFLEMSLISIHRFAGLYCVVLTGFAKGLDYRPGDKFKGSEYNHSWNVVFIDDQWYLVDSHWATRYLISEKNMAENLVSIILSYFSLTFIIQTVFKSKLIENIPSVILLNKILFIKKIYILRYLLWNYGYYIFGETKKLLLCS